jgi:hypothetical protein
MPLKAHAEADGWQRKHWRIFSVRVSGPQLTWLKANGGGKVLRTWIDEARQSRLPGITVSRNRN